MKFRLFLQFLIGAHAHWAMRSKSIVLSYYALNAPERFNQFYTMGTVSSALCTPFCLLR